MHTTEPTTTHPPKPLRKLTAWDRAEDAPCERGTVGCCVLHRSAPQMAVRTDSDDTCETW